MFLVTSSLSRSVLFRTLLFDAMQRSAPFPVHEVAESRLHRAVMNAEGFAVPARSSRIPLSALPPIPEDSPETH